MTMQELAEQIQREFHTFRDSNDRRLSEVERFGTASRETVEMVNRANTAITALQTRLDETVRDQMQRLEDMENRLNRPLAGGDTTRGLPEERVRLYARWQGMVQFNAGRTPTADLDPSQVDLDFIRNYQRAFRNWVRRGERASQSDLTLLNEMSAGKDAEGGYWIEPDTTGSMIQFQYETSPMRRLATVETISSDSLEGTYDLDEAAASWVGETESRSDTNTPGIGQWKIPVHEQYAQPRATQKLLDDALVDVEGWLANKVRDKFGRGENTAFVTGSGVLKPRGFTTYTAGTPAGTTVAAYQVIRQVNSGAAANLASDGLLDLFYALKSPYRNGAVFGMNRATEADVRQLKSGTGEYMFAPDLNGRLVPSLFGYPIEELPDMANVSAGTLPIVWGNIRAAYTIVDRLGIRVLRDPYTAKPYVRFYTTKRVGGDVLDFDAIVLQKVSA